VDEIWFATEGISDAIWKSISSLRSLNRREICFSPNMREFERRKFRFKPIPSHSLSPRDLVTIKGRNGCRRISFNPN
ncbi:hypothetical protein GIB67_033894, partial [Kingdonia uniflora]